MDEHTDVIDLVITPTNILRFVCDHAQQSINVRVYQSPVLDEETQELGPLELTNERQFHSYHSGKLFRLLFELSPVGENPQ